MTPFSQPLPPALTANVFQHLGVAAGPPSLDLLGQLVTAYTRTVPWESALRIVKRADTAELAACPRWPEEFWFDALAQGGGGTCFESNYAFFSLLQALGYAGFLTINNMGKTVGCHTAILINLDGEQWLVDAGFPVYAPLAVSAAEIIETATPFHTYTVRPDGNWQAAPIFQIERDRHPQSNCFTLVATPISEADYRAATTADYDENGLFLDRVIINKVVNGQQYRFASSDLPYRLERYVGGEKTELLLPGDLDAVAQALAQQFGMPAATLRQALEIVRSG